MRIVWYTIWSFLLFASCQDEEIKPKNSLVLEGYLFANSAVDNIKVSRLGGFGEFIENEPINDALVLIIFNNQPYLLEKTAGSDGIYSYTGNDLPILEGERYDIAVLHEGDTLFGSTTVPPKPAGLAQSSQAIKSGLFAQDSTTITTIWNQNHDFWSPVIISMEQNPQEIPGNEAFRFSYSTPSSNPFFEINRINLTYYGLNALIVYSVNEEYVILFDAENPENFFESPTNLVNGFGVFTAFNSDSLFFEVLP